MADVTELDSFSSVISISTGEEDFACDRVYSVACWMLCDSLQGVIGVRKRHSRWIGRGSWVVLWLITGSALIGALFAYFRRLDVAAGVAGVVAAGAAVATVYQAWAGGGADNREARLDLAGVAAQFVIAVRDQWQCEAERRRLNDPYPLDVRWVPVDTPLAADWEVLKRVALEGVGRPSPPLHGRWARGPEVLAGGGGDLARAVARVPIGRLLVLGKPGAGKTMLMVRLVLDLLERRKDGDPVPVLVSLASWNPATSSLRQWFAQILVCEYPALALLPPPERAEATRADALLNAGLIMPVLDGLDEVQEELRNVAVERINAWPMGTPLVVTGRIGQAADTAAAPGQPLEGIGTPLQAAAVQLCPLDAHTVTRYLSHGALSAPARWQSVISQIGTDSAAGMALTTPLLVALARAVYDPWPGDDHDLDTEPDPSQLADPAMPTYESVEQRLFDQFIDVAYGHDADSRWPAEKSEIWLMFLARHLQHTIDGPDLGWWQLWKAVPPVIFALAAGLWTALATGIAAGLGHGVGRGVVPGLIVGFAAAPFGGLAGGLAIGLAVGRWRRTSAPRGTSRRQQLRGLIAGVAVGLAAMAAVGITFGLASGLSHGLVKGLRAGWIPGVGSGLAIGLTVGLAAAWWRLPQPSPGMRRRCRAPSEPPKRVRLGTTSITAGVVTGLGAGLTVGLPYGAGYGALVGLATGLAISFAYGLQRRPSLTAAATPQTALTRERRAALLIGFPGVLAVGLVFGVGFPAAYGAIVGLTSGLAVGMIVSTLKTAWPAYCVARMYLALCGKLPWRLMHFLEDAYRRGILRQEGSVYQFRHQSLQEHLDARAGRNAGQR